MSQEFTPTLALQFRAVAKCMRRTAKAFSDPVQCGETISDALFVEAIADANGNWNALLGYCQGVLQGSEVYADGTLRRAEIEVAADSDLLAAAKLLAPGVQCMGELVKGKACGKSTCPACALHAAIAKAEGVQP